MILRKKAVIAEFILTVLIITSISGCVTSDNSASNEEINHPVTSVYSENDSMSEEYGVTGDTVIIRLDENPTTGYTWNMTSSSGVELLNDSYTQDTEAITGAGGLHQWTFKLTGNGEQNISGIYKRPWEENTGTEDTFVLNIMVLNEDELIKSSGTVTYIDLEGGFYGIVADDGVRYDPTNLGQQFLIDGTKVEFTAYPRNDVASFHMWGNIIEIRTIKTTDE